MLAVSKPKVCISCLRDRHPACRLTVLAINDHREGPGDLGLLPVPCGCECRAAQLELELEEAIRE